MYRALSKPSKILTMDQFDAFRSLSGWETTNRLILCYGEDDAEVRESTSTTWDEDSLIYP